MASTSFTTRSGGDLAETAFRSLRWNGRYLVLGFAAGHIPFVSAQPAAAQGRGDRRRLLEHFTRHEPRQHAANLELLHNWYGQGLLKPHVSRTFALADAPAAIRWVMDRKALGKVVVTP